MESNIDKEFEEALKYSKEAKEPFKLSNDEKLKFYAYFK